MADSQPAKSKRQVKNPETFRERAVKASQASDKPKRTDSAKRATGKLASGAARPFKKAGGIRVLQPVWAVFRFIGKILFPKYLRSSWQELKLVTWPSRKQSRQLTVAVLIFAAIFGAAIALVDYGLDKLFKNLIIK